MNTLTTQTTTPYTAHIAQALVAYAETSSNFAQWLTALIAMHVPQDIEMSSSSQMETIPAFVPQNTETAMRRAHWLIAVCTRGRLTDTQHTLSILTQWSHVREDEKPKAFVLGIDMGYAPLGIWGKWKSKNETMDIVFRADTVKDAPTETARTLTHLSNQLVASGLILANGHTGLLEPELGEWLFGDKCITLHTTSTKTLTAMHTYVEKHNIPCATAMDTNGIQALAITPAIQIGDLPHSDTLTTLTE